MGSVEAQRAEEMIAAAELDNTVVPAPPATEQPLFTNPADWFTPAFPERLEDLDVNPGFLADLTLKTVPLDTDCTTYSIATRLRLGMMITEALLQRLCQEKFIEAKGVVGIHNHRYAMLDHGWEALRRLNSFCSYAGPAPVSLKAYTEM